MKHINKEVIILQTLGSIGAFSIGVILFSSFIGWCGYWFFDACKYDLISIVNLGSKYTLFIVLSLFMVSGVLYIGYKFWEFWIKPFVDLMICRWRKVESKKVAELENDIYKSFFKDMNTGSKSPEPSESKSQGGAISDCFKSDYFFTKHPIDTHPCCQNCGLSDLGLKSCGYPANVCGALNGYKKFLYNFKLDKKDNIVTPCQVKTKVGKPITRKAAIKVAKQIQRKAERKRKA